MKYIPCARAFHRCNKKSTADKTLIPTPLAASWPPKQRRARGPAYSFCKNFTPRARSASSANRPSSSSTAEWSSPRKNLRSTKIAAAVRAPRPLPPPPTQAAGCRTSAASFVAIASPRSGERCVGTSCRPSHPRVHHREGERRRGRERERRPFRRRRESMGVLTVPRGLGQARGRGRGRICGLQRVQKAPGFQAGKERGEQGVWVG